MILIPVVVIAIVWARGIAYMNENHPDYKGDDFLNWNKDDKNN